MDEAINKMVKKFLSDLYFVSEGKTWFGNKNDGSTKEANPNSLHQKIGRIFSLSDVQIKFILNTWLIENGLSMSELDEYWKNNYWDEDGLKDVEEETEVVEEVEDSEYPYDELDEITEQWDEEHDKYGVWTRNIAEYNSIGGQNNDVILYND